MLPVTRTLLFEEVISHPMMPLKPATVPSLEITMLLPLPYSPTKSSPELVKVEPAPVTSTELFEAVLVYPM